MRFRPDHWLWGLPVVALIGAAATWFAVPRLEAELRRELQDTGEVAALRRVGARVELRGRDAIIVADFEVPAALRAGTERAAAALGTIRRLRTETAIPVTLQPYRLTVRRGPSGLELEGGVPPGGLHAHLVDIAGRMPGGDALDDRLVPAFGAPPAFAEAADIAVRLAGHLAGGGVTLTGTQLAVQGEAADFAAYNAAMASLLELPLGFEAATVDIAPPTMRPFAWKAARDGAGLVLSGYVPSEAARAALRAAAEAALPGGEISDTMQTARGLDSGIDFAAMTNLALSALSRLDRGTVDFDGRRFALSGAGKARDLLEPLGDEIRKSLPANVGAGPIALTSIAASPYRFAARRSKGRVTLTGFAPSEAARDAVVALAGQRFVGQAVVNDLHVADGSPAEFATAAALGLDVLSDIAEGDVKLVDRNLTLTGRALYRDLSERTGQRVRNAVPSGWTGTAELRTEPAEKPLDGGLCGDLLGDVVRREPIRFEPGRADIMAASRPILDALTGIVRRCGAERIRVVGHVQTAGDLDNARALAGARAAAVADALSKAGSVRLSPEGTSSKSASAETDRLSFAVEP